MDLGWVGMTSVWSEKVRTSRWTSRWTSRMTTGGASGSTSESKVIRWNQEELGWVRNGQGWFQPKLRRSTWHFKVAFRTLITAQKLKVILSSYDLDINESQACSLSGWALWIVDRELWAVQPDQDWLHHHHLWPHPQPPHPRDEGRDINHRSSWSWTDMKSHWGMFLSWSNILCIGLLKCIFELCFNYPLTDWL